jgi:alpha-galactosidase
MTELIVLHGSATSLVLEAAAHSAPLWRYWGPRLADNFVAGPWLADEPNVRGFQLDQPVRLALFPGGGLGWFARAALAAHRAGSDFAFRPTEAHVTANGRRVIVILDDRVTDIQVTLTLSLDADSDVLTIDTKLANTGDTPLDVQWLASAALPLPAEVTRVRSYSGRHANEFALVEDQLGKGTWQRANRRGISSHDAFPGAIVITDRTHAHCGPAFAAQLAWSGNHVQAIEWLEDGRRLWQLGLELAPGELILAPGESIDAPSVLASFSPSGWQGIARNFHVAARRRIDWPGGDMRPRPVHLNTWEACYFDHDEAGLIDLASRAAALGVERFVLDDGWFHRRDNDTRALGDWWPDTNKYPNGLRPLAEAVVALGMQFGLWIEPEMVSPDSELCRAHPEWVLQLAGRAPQTSRQQLVLDLTRPAVADHLFTTIGKLVAELPVAYLKWDHNRDLVAAGDAMGRAAYRRQTLAYYALVERFRRAFPDVEIEACAGGGGRIDAGIAARVHRFWPSDCMDALSRLHIQRGFLQFLPPEMMGCHIGAVPAHTTGRSQALDFRAAVACQGHLGIELDLRRLDQAETDRLRAWVTFYKRWRYLLHGETWTGEAADGIDWHAATAADEWLLFVYRRVPTMQRFMSPLCLPFVAADAHYAVSRIGPENSAGPVAFDGSWLQQAGLPVPPMQAERAAIFHGKRQ